MPIINRIADFQQEMTGWRRDIHAHPETAFEEHRTADVVAEKLQDFGLQVHRGLAGTGVVGTLKGKRDNGRAIALRADMDALHIHEKNTFAHRSRNDGKMHACGHDGHTTMLLGAAKYLAETRNFAGTVHFVFQPAEENEGGGRVMVEDGLFEQFPVEAVYGMHNWPQMPVGTFAVRSGPMMAAFDIFELTIRGQGAHAALPHQGVDPVVVAAQIVTGLQSIASRATDPLDAVVVSVTQIHGGDTWNVIPDEVVLRGTVRTFKAAVQDRIEPSIQRIADGICQAHGASAELRYERRYPATVNTAAETDLAARAASAVVGADNVDLDPTPCMGSEDFAFMLQQRPGSYVWVGNAPREGERVIEGAGINGAHCMVHNPHYDFNDEVLPVGVSYWATLVEQTLGT
jgi:hippurate hydrolase